MKNSIIKQALELGFDFENFSNEDSLDVVYLAMIDFFNDHSNELPRIEDECEVSSHGHTQTVNHGNYTSSGEIVDRSYYWSKPVGFKVFHSDYVTEENGIMCNMNLYYCVPETQWNCPDGYVWDVRNKCHVKEEELAESK